MTRKNTRPQRAMVYIDGYNLYYGMKSAYGRRYKWLNLQAFAESLLRPGVKLVRVKYFTAVTKDITGPKQRQEIYLKALQAHCDKLDIFYGHFLSKVKSCRNCGDAYTQYEEKKTDVNIACEILNDAHLDRYDYCYIVSGDSDLTPPLAIIKQNHPDKTVIVAHPPRRKSIELCDTANGWFAIGAQKFKRNQLPPTVTSPGGGRLTKPAEWGRP